MDDLDVVAAYADKAEAWVRYEDGTKLAVKRLKTTWSASLDSPDGTLVFVQSGRRREAAAEQALVMWRTWMGRRR